MNNFNDLSPKRLKSLNFDEIKELANNIRKFIIDKVIDTGGHLGSNLGVVELTIALHYVFNSPDDQLIFDIGHQAYTHKIITGRSKGFDNLRKEGGISGFTSYHESIHDVWEAGHAGTALSALMGVLYSNKIDKSNNRAIAIVGDGGLSTGMSLEALNLIGYHKLPGIIVINNNKMSISKSVGKLSEILTSDYTAKETFFNSLGYNFYEIKDGHNLKELINTLETVKLINKPLIVVVNTIKGKGHLKAENDEIGTYHMISSAKANNISWSEVISKIILDIQKEIPTMVVVPAMEIGSHLTPFKLKYPDRFLDVGISEEHAATMSAALVKNNKNVILSLYSTFSQRAYDQILNDIARPNLGVVITIDRAGLIAGDGDTHQGIYDVSMFNAMPNMTITSPSNVQDASDLLRYGLKSNKPFVMRFPKGYALEDIKYTKRDIKPNWDIILEGESLNIITYGPIVQRLYNIAKNHKLDVNIINAKFIKPMDLNALKTIFSNEKPILVIEENVNVGGLYPQILRYKQLNNYNNKVVDYNLNDLLVPHLSKEEIMDFAKFDDESLLKLIRDEIR